MDQQSYSLFLETLHRFVRQRLVPAEKELIETDQIPPDIVIDMAELGLFGLSIPSQYGGAGMTAQQYLNVVAELAWAAPAYRSVTAIGNGIFGMAVLKYGNDIQKTQWLPKIAAGTISSFALTEPDSGSDAAALKTTAIKEGAEYVLNGVKRYITNAPSAEVVLVMAKTAKESLPGNTHISAFLVPTNIKGVSISSPDKKMGQSGTHIADVILENVRVPESALLGGQEGLGFSAAMQSLNNGRLSVAAACLGASRRALDSAVRYAIERKAFGEPIANFQLIQAKIADSEAEIFAIESMLNEAARRLDNGDDIRKQAACTKMFASEACGRIVDRVVQIFGGAGYLREYHAERFFRDARIYRIYEGTTEILQLAVAKQVLREYANAVN